MTNLCLYTSNTGIGVVPSEKALFNLVIYDVDTTLNLSLQYTTTSIITNLAHILEAWYSEKRSPGMGTS